mmetsp:Transcript_32211/g.67333  ORF Transcript_32211/g.67333 Transcript_32211/m.67333 type:complete len:82 (-) Transcript_32211:1623-1868(-)
MPKAGFATTREDVGADGEVEGVETETRKKMKTTPCLQKLFQIWKKKGKRKRMKNSCVLKHTHTHTIACERDCIESQHLIGS